jgi:hypothetical protein
MASAMVTDDSFMPLVGADRIFAPHTTNPHELPGGQSASSGLPLDQRTLGVLIVVAKVEELVELVLTWWQGLV